jgi:peptidoglycan/xylan/chitin deacetylase (PgdA/CDA1 family)
LTQTAESVPAELKEKDSPEIAKQDAGTGIAQVDLEKAMDTRIYERYCNIKSGDEKTVYLTIDDGPHPLTTPAYLRILAEKGVKATFFVLGCQVQQYPDLVRMIRDEGHVVGNHTYSHNYRYLYKSKENYLGELVRTGELLKEVLGEDTALTRAPGGTIGHFRLDFYRGLEDYGYITYDWNIDTQDALFRNITAERIMANVRGQTGRKKEIIVLMHDLGKKGDIQALPMIIDFYRDAGYEFRAISKDTPALVHRTAALQNLRHKFMDENSPALGR